MSTIAMTPKNTGTDERGASKEMSSQVFGCEDHQLLRVLSLGGFARGAAARHYAVRCPTLAFWCDMNASTRSTAASI